VPPSERAPHRVRRDPALLLSARTLRAFAFGFSIVLFGVHLQQRGLSAAVIGVLIGIGLFGSATTSLVSAYSVTLIGRRRTLALIGVMMTLTGLDLAFASNPTVLALGALTGMFGAGWVDLGPFLAVEQAMLTEAVPSPARNRAFARYSLVGAIGLSLGGLAASRATGPSLVTQFYLLYAVIGLVTAALPLALSPAVEQELRLPAFGKLRPLLKLTGLLMIDSFSGSFAVPALIAFWLHLRFGANTEVLGPTFAVITLLQAASYELSGRIADRIGLINAMVWTHLPAVLLFMVLPFSPNLEVAIGLLFVFSSMSEMDVPARQAYLVSIVPRSERVGAVALTGAARAYAQIVGPVISGVAFQIAAFGLPFFIYGGGKLLFLAGLYSGFRGVRGDHEV
jgi:MFS family permease